MKTISGWMLIAVLMVSGVTGGCSDRNLESRLGLSDPTLVWSSLGMAGLAFTLTNHTGRDITLTHIELLVDERTPEEVSGDSLVCPGTTVEFGDLFFNISRDSPDHLIKIFSPVGGEAPTTELTIPADDFRTIEALVFNHMHPGVDGREVDFCRIRVRVELDGASSTSRPIEIRFNATGS